MKIKKIIAVLKGILFIALITIFLSAVLNIVYVKDKEKQENKELQEIVTRQETKKETTETETSKKTKETESETKGSKETKKIAKDKSKEILSEYKELYEDNKNLYGWIKIEDTVINYPVMFTPDKPSYYLHHDWEGKESVSGIPFVDERTVEGETENVIIYGHNMKNRTMFGSLREYKDKTYYQKHKYIQFDTIHKKAEYEIIAVYKAIAYYDEEPEDEYLFYYHQELDTKKEFNEYIRNAKNNSYFDTGVTATYGDSLITLSTCDYWTENARLNVVAKKIQSK